MYLVVDISFVVSMHCVAKHYHAGCDAVLLITKCVYQDAINLFECLCRFSKCTWHVNAVLVKILLTVIDDVY